MARKNINKKLPTYYHGSNIRIPNKIIKAVPQRASKMHDAGMAAFVTTDKKFAEISAIRRSIVDKNSGYTILDRKNHKIFADSISPKIKNKIYVYTAYKSKGVNMIHDYGSEFFCESDIKCETCDVIDLIAAIKDTGCKIYVLDKPLAPGLSIKERDDAFDCAIKAGKYKRVNIKKILKQQQKRKSGKNNWFSKLRDAVSNLFD